MAGKENSAMTILMDFAKPCKGKLIGSVVLAILGALCFQQVGVSGIDCFYGLSRAGVVRNFFYNEKP